MIVPVYIKFNDINRLYDYIASVLDLYFLDYGSFPKDVLVNFSTQYFIDKYNLVTVKSYRSEIGNPTTMFESIKHFDENRGIIESYIEYIKANGCKGVFENLVQTRKLDLINNSRNIFIACFDMDEFIFLNDNFETLNVCVCLDSELEDVEKFDFNVNYIISSYTNHRELKEFLKNNLE